MNTQPTWRLWILVVLLISVSLFATCHGLANAQGNPFPQNAEAASDNFGIAFQRSDQTDQWEVCDVPVGTEVQCWHLKPGLKTNINLEPWEWAQTNVGVFKDHEKAIEVEVEEASIRPDWEKYPAEETPPTETVTPTITATVTVTTTATVTPSPTEGNTPEPTPTATPQEEVTPLPEIPVNEPLAKWPATKQEAVIAFSPNGSAIPLNAVTACDGWEPGSDGGCWTIQSNNLMAVSVPKGALGQIGPDKFVTQTGLWVMNISLRPDWENLPSEPEPTATPEPDPTPIPQNPQLRGFPQTAENAAQAFGVEGERSAQANQWSQCDNWQQGQFVGCWQLKDAEGTPLSLPKGANAQIWDGTSHQKVGPWTGIVGQATIRAQWSDIDPIELFIPSVIRN